jgi:hypothetical protein
MTGPHVAALPEGVADRFRQPVLPRDIDGAIVDRSLDEQARARDARLARIAEALIDAGANGAFEIGVGEDDGGRLAAQFQ